MPDSGTIAATFNQGEIMVALKELSVYCNALLNTEHFQDYCPNGLQLEGRPEVSTIVSGVTASQALIEAAIQANADLLLVHHGYFWKGENPTLTGIKRRRIKSLLDHDISLLAYHLPLDAHRDYGNNAALARVLGFQTDGVVDQGPGADILYFGRLAQSLSLQVLSEHIFERLAREPTVISAGDFRIRTIAWCTGAAQRLIEHAADLGVDAYLSGEISEQTMHIARESQLHYIAAGHHATERYGPQALGDHLAQRFNLQHQFIDMPNPA